MNTLLLRCFAITLLSVTTGYCAIIQLSGTFSGEFNVNPDGNFLGTNTQTFSGSWAASYDSTSIPSLIGTSELTLTLASFSLTPTTIRETTFTPANSNLKLTFEDGDLDRVFLGGMASGAESLSVNETDFLVSYGTFFDPFQVSDFLYNLEGGIAGGTHESFTSPSPLSGSFEIIPESSSFALVLASVLSLTFRRRRSNKPNKMLR